MFSMTGYGGAEYKKDGLDITVEIKTINNRFLDVNAKYPRSFNSIDDVIRKTVSESLSRGRVDVFINVTDNRENAVKLVVDESLASDYVATAKKLMENYGVSYDFSVTSLMRMPDVVKQEESTDESELNKITIDLLGEALKKLNLMRETEGERLRVDMLSRVDRIEELLGKIKEYAPKLAEIYREKLKERITEYLGDVKYDEARLMNEVAFFADKSNIDEEITRLYSHILQFRKICEEKTVGRKLDFLIQEFNRESNTICSKSNSSEITALGLELKCEIEKIREQIQNLE